VRHSTSKVASLVAECGVTCQDAEGNVGNRWVSGYGPGTRRLVKMTPRGLFRRACMISASGRVAGGTALAIE
jgi:hypothetical protein